jgi:hypothetical protein
VATIRAATDVASAFCICITVPLVRPVCYISSRHSRNRLPPHIEVSSQGYSSKKKHRCTERISSRTRRDPPYCRDRPTNHGAGSAGLTIARLLRFPLTQTAWMTAASTSATTGGHIHASPDSGDNWSPIVRDLSAVLSVEVQTRACRRLRQKHVTVAVPCLSSPHACPKCCRRGAMIGCV